MNSHRSQLRMLPLVDSAEIAEARRKELDIPRDRAAYLGRSAVEAADNGFYVDSTGGQVDWKRAVQGACAGRVSIPPDASLPALKTPGFSETRVQIANETTLGASRRLLRNSLTPLALNFANGVEPGGGFLTGSKAQEEVLCRSSALYHTLAGDRMYEVHRARPQPDSTAWAIYSPAVPVFRTDDGTALAEPWYLDVITCAAPYAPAIGQPTAGNLLQQRIHRVLAIARAYGHATLVLGAWGCGAFKNDPLRTAQDFKSVLEGEFVGCFSDVVFAVTDWSDERRFIRPFRDVFGE